MKQTLLYSWCLGPSLLAANCFVSFIAPSQRLRPFLPDKKLPFVQEFAVVSLQEPKAFVRDWSDGAQLGQELHLYSTLQCQLVDYRNLTLLPLLQPFSLQGHAIKKYTHSQQTELMFHFNMFLEPMLITVGQHIIHTLDTAVKAWKQVRYTHTKDIISMGGCQHVHYMTKSIWISTHRFCLRLHTESLYITYGSGKGRIGYFKRV